MRDEQPAATWRLKRGATVEGRIIRYRAVHTIFGPATIAVIADKERGPVSVFLRPVALVREFARLRPKPGQSVTLRCLGKPDGRTWDFAVSVKKGGRHR